MQAYLQATSQPASELFNSSNRAYPDVAALGGGNNRYCIAINPVLGWMGEYGTSASSPVFAGGQAPAADTTAT